MITKTCVLKTWVVVVRWHNGAANRFGTVRAHSIQLFRVQKSRK